MFELLIVGIITLSSATYDSMTDRVEYIKADNVKIVYTEVK